MKLKQTSELLAFLSTQLTDDPGADEQCARAYVAVATPARLQQLVAEAKAFLDEAELPLDDLGSEANRWFADSDEARDWLQGLVNLLQEASGGSPVAGVAVKDSNGAPLSEGDSVTVIKDLKVKGGSSDLKRGTLIKKIHLVDDVDVVECRVDGSTLVLKTCFLKKA